jgi:catechol 2,3-dioxygenase-like lactoylglutathione lyase family enzyme
MFKKIAFIHYSTQNLEQALKFYRDILGLKLLVQTEEWVEFEVGGQRLALRLVDPWTASAEPPSTNSAMIWLEACPIEKTIEILKSKKVIFINDLEVFSYGKTAIFKDPDGNPIGLYEPPEKNA